MMMTLDKFHQVLGLQKPLLAVEGNIFDTPADHIAFAVHWPNAKGYSNNNNGGFASRVAEYGWEDLRNIKFTKGEPITKKIRGKFFHAMPVHTPEEGGWEESPTLIERCLNKLPVNSVEVIATVLIGGGDAGQKYKASVRNLEGMIRSYKTVVLYIHDNTDLYDLLVGTGVVASPIPREVSLLSLPKVYNYRDFKLKQLVEH